MEKYFVTFLSPGTFLAETSSKNVDSWDVDEAVMMADAIVERYGARPYGFYFTTRTRTDNELDSRQTAKSGTYYLNSAVETYEQIERRDNPDDKILLSNMKGNDWNYVAVSLNGYKSVQPLYPGDIVLAPIYFEMTTKWI